HTAAPPISEWALLAKSAHSSRLARPLAILVWQGRYVCQLGEQFTCRGEGAEREPDGDLVLGNVADSARVAFLHRSRFDDAQVGARYGTRREGFHPATFA